MDVEGIRWTSGSDPTINWWHRKYIPGGKGTRCKSLGEEREPHPDPDMNPPEALSSHVSLNYILQDLRICPIPIKTNSRVLLVKHLVDRLVYVPSQRALFRTQIAVGPFVPPLDTGDAVDDLCVLAASLKRSFSPALVHNGSPG